MTTFELAGQAMLQMQEGNRGFAQALVNLFRRDSHAAAPASLSGATFIEQEPDLAAEAHLPEVMRTI